MDSEGALQPVTLGRNLSRKQKPIGWIPKNEWAKIALLVSLVQCILASGIELYIAVSHNNYVADLTTSGFLTTEQEAQGNAIVVYHVLFIASQFFQLILIADAVSFIIIMIKNGPNLLVDAIIVNSVGHIKRIQLGYLGLFCYSNGSSKW